MYGQNGLTGVLALKPVEVVPNLELVSVPLSTAMEIIHRWHNATENNVQQVCGNHIIYFIHSCTEKIFFV